MNPKPIETSYKGYRFRSRLEARWAVFFENIGAEWEYEPQGFDLGDGMLYLPDFRVRWPGEERFHWVEVKPGAPDPDELEKVFRLAEATATSVALLIGVPAVAAYPVVVHLCDDCDGCRLWCNLHSLCPIGGGRSLFRMPIPFVTPRIVSPCWSRDFSSDRGWLLEEPEAIDPAPVPVRATDFAAMFRPRFDRFTRSVTRARSARFEHGESPR